jgi:hypothetical protein
VDGFLIGLVLLQFDGPVGLIEELLPACVLVGAQAQADDGVASWLTWGGDEFHVGLVRGAAALLGVASDTAADKVGPGAEALLASWDDVVEAEFASVEVFAAVLAEVAVAGEDVSSVELDALAWEFFVAQQADDFGDGELHPDGADPFVFVVGEAGVVAVCGVGGVGPVFEVVGGVGAVVDTDDFGEVFEEHGERASGVHHADRHPELVQYQHVAV